MVFAFRCKGLPHSLAPTPRNSCTRLHPAAGPSRLLEQLAGCRTSPLLLLLLFLLLLLLLLLLPAAATRVLCWAGACALNVQGAVPMDAVQQPPNCHHQAC